MINVGNLLLRNSMLTTCTSSKPSVRIKVKSPANRHFKRYVEFQKMNDYSCTNKYAEKSDVGGKSTNNKSLTFLERLNRDGYRASVDKSKWLSRNDFNGRIGRATTGNGFDKQANMTCVQRDPSEPPVLHKFRDKSPSNWIAGSFKF
jgi:hypothetical protein